MYRRGIGVGVIGFLSFSFLIPAPLSVCFDQCVKRLVKLG
jgi:hypothetical protein